ncbi:bacillithiol biosynthesis deacetylase BshB1 [Alteribacillus persepolensis]|uniref:Bacillithiol biosynthesis deacetylase BshB1 n=1 Tax=Alteribacillus persepolensis TaxID=568899 RepID=A0A1G7ZE70_9BACI|nr:bacillithiol biosynthesis deacetylase BshB1 [Alteribacillus persepolensis]SDH06826.1 bacillithiol biosynthesis deacetylase BshB1 [Alteribacillus persepolensis]
MNKRVILAVGAHPDDVEIGMGGSIAVHAENGDDVYICSLTRGELSSNGTIEQRQHEADQAGAILGITKRFQLNFFDRFLSREDQSYKDMISLIRDVEPDTVFAPFYEDRHPDHGACSRLVREAVFDAKIHKFPGISQPAHQTPSLFYYCINGVQIPDFYVDISRTQPKKEKALAAFQSQFVPKQDSIKTPLTDRYIESVRARDSLFGKEANTVFAEGFKRETPLVFSAVPKRSSQ